MVRVASPFILAAVVFSLVLPMVDHHWAERTPIHSHMVLNGTFGAIPPHHHPYEAWHQHTHASVAKPVTPFMAMFNYDSGGESGIGLPSEPLLSAQLPRLPVPVFSPSLPTTNSPYPAGLSSPPEPPPPRTPRTFA